MSRRVTTARRSWGDDDRGCSILHVDMDAFFASVELVRRPDLRGRPVIVGGDGRSVVLAATYEARAFGVHSAMPMARALRLCPAAVVLPPDRQAYGDASRAVMAVLRDVTPVVEQVSVDEAFLDVSGAHRRMGSPGDIAAAIRRRVRAEVEVTCSVGIAATKVVAKLASGFAKPDGVMLVPRDATVDFLQSLPVEAMWGVGERTREQLARWGITTVREVAHADPALLRRAVGRAAGAHLLDLARGRDPRPVVPDRQEKSVGAETTLAVDTRDMAVVQARLLELSDRCGAELRRRGHVARTVSVKVRTADFRTLTRSRTLPVPTDTAREVYLVARELVAGVDLAGRAVRLLGVRAEGLTQVGTRAVTLEESVDEGTAARRAEAALDDVRARFGASALRPAALLARSRPVPEGDDAASTTAHGERDLS